MTRRDGAGWLIVLWLVAACLVMAGCRRFGSGVGDTVPSPPRDLIEKSYRGARAPAGQPGTGNTGQPAGAPR